MGFLLVKFTIMNKFLYIATGVFIVGYWIYSKISVAANLSIKPLKFTVEPGIFATNATVQLLLKNETGNVLKVDQIAGKLSDASGRVYGTFRNNYTIKLKPQQTIIASFTIETLTTDLIDLAQTNYKNLILRGTSVIEGLYIPFNISIAKVWQ